MRTCKVCGELKNDNQFYKHNKSTCIACIRIRNKIHAMEVKERDREKNEIMRITNVMILKIEGSIGKYPPKVRKIMKKQLECYKSGTTQAIKIHRVLER